MTQNTIPEELEQEVKFEAPIDLALPDLRHLVGRTVRLPEEQLATTYFDTVDRRLWQQGLTLRHRREGDDDGTWTLKLPNVSHDAALQRTEVMWPGLSYEMPASVRDVMRGVVRREPLHEMVLLKTRRQRLVLKDDEDEEVAELDDDHVLVVGGPRDGTRFRQVELEFRDREWNGNKVVRQLQRAGVHIERDPKLAKALDLPSAASSRNSTVTSESTVAEVVQAFLRAGMAQLVAHDWRLRLAPSQPAAHDVHQARVATRRLRSNLKTFGAVLDPVWLRHARGDLKWLGAALGEVRDVDVLANQFIDAPIQIRQRLAVRRTASSQRLSEVLTSRRYLDLVDRLHAGSELLPLAQGAEHAARQPAAYVLPSLVAARWRAVRRQVRRFGPHPSPGELHRIRIKSKQLRYAAQAATPVIGKAAKKTASAAESVQTVLGQHHDAVVAERWLRDEWKGDLSIGPAPSVSSNVSFEAGRLVAEARQRQRKSRRCWTKAWAKLRDPKRRRWFPKH